MGDELYWVESKDLMSSGSLELWCMTRDVVHHLISRNWKVATLRVSRLDCRILWRVVASRSDPLAQREDIQIIGWMPVEEAKRFVETQYILLRGE